MWERMWSKGNPCALLMSTATMENSVELPQKIKNRATYDPATPLLGIYLKVLKTFIHIDAPLCSLQHYPWWPRRHGINLSALRLDKEDVYTPSICNGILLRHKKI